MYKEFAYTICIFACIVVTGLMELGYPQTPLFAENWGLRVCAFFFVCFCSKTSSLSTIEFIDRRYM